MTRAAQVHSDDYVSSQSFLHKLIAASQPAGDIHRLCVYKSYFRFQRPDFCPGMDRSPVSHSGSSGSITCHIPWDLWWTEWLRDRIFSRSTYVLYPPPPSPTVSIIRPMLRPESLICHRRCIILAVCSVVK